jgi:hypothetical protein
VITAVGVNVGKTVLIAVGLIEEGCADVTVIEGTTVGIGLEDTNDVGELV